jgi:hypothetical protein
LAKSSFITLFFVANFWRNLTFQFLYSLAKMAKGAAVVANDGGIINLARFGENFAKPGA